MKDFIKANVTIANASDKVQSFVPYAQSFLFKLQPQTAIQFPTNSTQAIYYTKQNVGPIAAQAVGANDVKITCGTYNGTFTPSEDYMLVGGKVIGEIPYDSVDGNVVAVKFVNPRIASRDSLPSGYIYRNSDSEYEFTKDSFEEDGSLIYVSPLTTFKKWVEIDWGNGFVRYDIDCSHAKLASGEQPGPVPPTPGELTPFSIGKTISGIDFGDVQNGDTSAEMDAFLAGLTYEGTDPTVIVNDSENVLFATNFDEAYVLAVDSEEPTIVYSSVALSEQGITQGFQNLTNGKYTLQSAIEVTDVNPAEGWNGILIGAVEGGGN